MVDNASIEHLPKKFVRYKSTLVQLAAVPVPKRRRENQKKSLNVVSKVAQKV